MWPQLCLGLVLIVGTLWSCCGHDVISFGILAIVFVFFVYQYLINAKTTLNLNVIRGKRVLITGASSGIGEQLAYQYAKLGASLLITARRQELLEKIVRNCRYLGAQRVQYVVADMAQSKDREKLVGKIKKNLGGLDHLILNHAIRGVCDWVATDNNIASLLHFLDVNFVSYVDVASRCMDMLIASRGNIGVTSSMAGKMCFVLAASYCSSKFALQGFFGVLRQELRLKKTGVSVTLCVLGNINTEAFVTLVETRFPSLLVTNRCHPEGAAYAIMMAVTDRKFELYYPRCMAFFNFVHELVPRFVEEFVGGVLFQSFSSNLHHFKT